MMDQDVIFMFYFLFLYIGFVDLEVGNSSGTNSFQLDDGSGAVKGYRGRSLWLERFGTSLKRAAKFLSYFGIGTFYIMHFCVFTEWIVYIFFAILFFSIIENVWHQPKESNRIFAAVVSSNAVECQFSLQLFFSILEMTPKLPNTGLRLDRNQYL